MSNDGDERDANAGDDPDSGTTAGGPADYDIGYARPPKQHQFQKGNVAATGKRSARRRQSFLDDLAAELGLQITIQEDGKSKKRTKQRLLARNAVHGALKDGGKALSMLRALAQLYPPEIVQEERPLTADEQAIFDQFLKRNGMVDNGSDD